MAALARRGIRGFMRHLIPRHSTALAPRRFLPCTVESPEERTNWWASQFAEEEEWFCIAANLLHKRRNGIPWNESDQKNDAKIDKRFREHRDRDLDALIQREQGVVDAFERAKGKVIKAESAGTQAQMRLNDLKSKRKSPEWYANR